MKKFKKITFIISILVILLSFAYLIVNKYIINYSVINKYSKIEDIKDDKEKINMYIFWGNGCPHCKELFEYLEKNYNDYKNYINIYSFEVWDNKDNGEVMDLFLEKFDGKVGSRGVPYFIIGDKVFEGYNSKMNEEIEETITKKYKERKNIISFNEIKNK